MAGRTAVTGPKRRGLSPRVIQSLSILGDEFTGTSYETKYVGVSLTRNKVGKHERVPASHLEPCANG